MTKGRSIMNSKILSIAMLVALFASNTFAQQGSAVQNTLNITNRIQNFVRANQNELTRRKYRAMMRNINVQLSNVLADLEESVVVNPFVAASNKCANEFFDSDIVSCYRNILQRSMEPKAKEILNICSSVNTGACYQTTTSLVVNNANVPTMEMVYRGCNTANFSSDKGVCISESIRMSLLSAGITSVDVLYSACVSTGNNTCFVEGFEAAYHSATPGQTVLRGCNSIYGFSKSTCLKNGVQALGRYDGRYAKVGKACGRLSSFAADACYGTALSNLQ